MRYILLLFIVFLAPQTWAAEIPISQITEAIELASPDSKYQYYQFRARAYSKRNMPEMALADLTSSINLNPTIMAYRERADILAEMGRYQEALNDTTACINMSPTSIDLRERTDILMKMGRYQEALNDINTILKTEPGNLDMYRLRSKAYFEVKQYNEALKDARRVLDEFPNDSASRLLLMESTSALSPVENIVIGPKGGSKRYSSNRQAGKHRVVRKPKITKRRLTSFSKKVNKPKTKTVKRKS